MKVIWALQCLSLFGLGWAHHGGEEEHLLATLIDSHINGNVISASISINNYVDAILEKCLEKVRSIIQNKEPYPIPDFPTQEISDKNVQANVTLTNIKENYASTFVVNSLKNSFLAMTEEFDITFPKLEYFGNYATTGKVLKKKVHGNGTFDVFMINLHTWGKSYAHLVNGYVQLKALTIDYTLEDISANATGLKVEGLSQKKVNELLSKALLQYFKNNEKLVSATISETVLKQVNTFLYGMSVSDLLKWLKHFISPPFTNDIQLH